MDVHIILQVSSTSRTSYGVELLQALYRETNIDIWELIVEDTDVSVDGKDIYITAISNNEYILEHMVFWDKMELKEQIRKFEYDDAFFPRVERLLAESFSHAMLPSTTSPKVLSTTKTLSELPHESTTLLTFQNVDMAQVKLGHELQK